DEHRGRTIEPEKTRAEKIRERESRAQQQSVNQYAGDTDLPYIMQCQAQAIENHTGTQQSLLREDDPRATSRGEMGIERIAQKDAEHDGDREGAHSMGL